MVCRTMKPGREPAAATCHRAVRVQGEPVEEVSGVAPMPVNGEGEEEEVRGGDKGRHDEV